MPTQLQHLQNNEAILLMYLGGELPPGDRDEVEQMLASDPNLRGELDALRATQEQLTGFFSRADAATPLPLARPVAVRQVARAIRQWQDDRAGAARAESRRRIRLPWWVYPSAAAAAILAIGFAWMANHDWRFSIPPDQPYAQDQPADGARGFPNVGPEEFEQFEYARALRRSFDSDNSSLPIGREEADQLLALSEPTNTIFPPGLDYEPLPSSRP
jgi:hypothetical protein